MAESIQEIFKRKLVPVRFERTMGLLGATTLGIGALMGAGIYVLIGLAAEKAGPAVWLSYLICGLLSLLSVYVFGELSRKVPTAGGGYAFAYNALGSFWGFITGWLLALGSIFAMGKDGFLPALLGRIHAVNRTPLMALGAGGMVTAAALIFSDLTFIVKSALFAISESLLNRQSGELVVLNVVCATAQVDFYSALSHAEDSVHLLDGSTQLPSSNQVKIRPVVRVSRSLPKGIVHAAEEENCNLIVMGFAGEEASASIRLVEDVLNDARTDVILFKLRGEFAPKRIGVSLGGSGNLNLIVRLAGALADRYGGHITFMNILPENYTAEQKAHSSKILVEAIRQHVAKALYRIEVASSDKPLDFLVERSAEFDLLVVGATKVKFLEKAAVGPFSSQIAMRSNCSVAIVRVAPAVKKIMSI